MKTKLFWFYFIFWFFYFALIWSQAIQVNSQGWFAAYIPHWADGAAHLSYMAAVAFRDHFPLTHPLFLDHPFSYSFAADALGGFLVKLGLSLPTSYNALGFLLSLATSIALWILLHQLTRSSLKTFLATTLFFFSGGLGFRYYLNPATTPPQESFFINTLTQIKNTDIVWLNTLVGELIPQRSFLLGLPLGVFILSITIQQFIYHRHFHPLVLLFTGSLLGLMLIIHPHTALIMAVSLCLYGLFNLLSPKNSRWQTLADLSLVAFPALLFGFILFSQFITFSTTATFFRFYPGWLAVNTHTNWLIFWLDNWGIFLPMAIIGTALATPQLKLLLSPFWLWFVLANLFLFQPYDWDNSKLLTWVYLLFTIPVSNLLATLIRRRHLASTLAAILLIILLTFSGAADALRMLDTHSYRLLLLTNHDLDLAAYVRSYTPSSSIILTSTAHNNWVPIATGRQILCGYRGWMWTYGINYEGRYQDIKAIYAGAAQALRLIHQYGINYIVVGPNELAEFNVNTNFFANNFPIFYQTDSTTIYQVN